jgi:ribosome recycling factor
LIAEVYKKTKAKMEETLKACEREFASLRTGRASSSLLDGIRVNCYAATMPLNQLATLSTPESHLIIIQPWDKTIIGDIEKAILESDLGLTPDNDGNAIRIALPHLTEERRKELTKIVKNKTEALRVSLRNERREAIEHLKKMEKDEHIPEDDSRKAQKKVQEMTDDFIKRIDELLETKEKEIMEV